MRPLQVLCTKCFTYIPCYIYTNHESQHKQVNLTNFVEKKPPSVNFFKFNDSMFCLCKTNVKPFNHIRKY